MSDPNENRAGYKGTKVGWIPEEWDTACFDEHLDIQTGYAFSSDGYTEDETAIRLLRGDNVTPNRIRWQNAKRWGKEETERIANYRLQENDLVLAMDRPWISSGVKVTVLIKEDVPSLLVQRVARIRASESDLGTFFVAHIGSKRFEYYIKSNQQEGGGVPHISGAQIRDFHFAAPPLSEQRKIAHILSTCDEAIEKTGALIDAKKRQKKALMQQLLTGKIRLPGFEGKWKTFRLGDLFTERAETNCEHLPLLAITGTRGIIPAADIARKDSSSADKSRYKAIYPGDIGYNTMRMWQGVSAVSRLEGIVSPAYTICTPTSRVDVGFMGYFFKFPPVVYLFWRFSQGLVNDTLNLKFPNFAVIHVAIPDKAEQLAITNILQSADEEITTLKKKKLALQQQKKSLMQKLLTGQVRVQV